MEFPKVKKISLFLSGFVISFGCFFVCKNCSPTIYLPVSLSDDQFPIVKTSISGKEADLELLLGSPYPVFLKQRLLSQLKTKEVGLAKWKDFDGNPQGSALYKIPQITVGSTSLKKSLAVSSEDYGERGVEGSFSIPIQNRGILFDFPHRNVVTIRNSSVLRTLGLDLKKMKKIPCTYKKGAIWFSCEVLGQNRQIALSINANKNCLSEEPKRAGEVEVHIPGIGETSFVLQKFPKHFEADIVLGVEFLLTHVVYLDPQKKHLYIGSEHANTFSKQSSDKIPLTFTKSGLPVIEVGFGDKKYRAVIDTGAHFEFLASEDRMPEIEKRLLGPIGSRNLFGEKKTLKSYHVPYCSLGKSIARNLIVAETSRVGIKTNMKVKGLGTVAKQEVVGNLGLFFLQRSNVLLDFPSKTVQFFERGAKLSPREWIHIPFRRTKNGLILEIETNLGKNRFLLDTGATGSCLNQDLAEVNGIDSWGNSCYSSALFKIGSEDFGSQNMYLFPFAREFAEMDGVLGMEFLKNHSIYLDFTHDLLYIKKTKNLGD